MLVGRWGESGGFGLEMGVGDGRKWGRTANMAFLTRSEVMRPLLVRFLIRAAFEEPEDIQAMLVDWKDGWRAGCD